MSQCPACLSHNAGSAAYCGHCGARLRRLAPTAGGGSRRYFLAALVVSLLLGALAWVLQVSSRESETAKRAPRVSREGGSLSAFRAERKTTDAADEEDAQRRPREPRVPTRHEVVSKLNAAFVVCELRDRSNRPWKKLRGLLVDPTGVVLCRYDPLLGAYGGTCILGNRTRARVEITGLMFRDEERDLALLQLRSSPADYPYVPLLVENPWEVLEGGDPLFVFSDYKPFRSSVGEAYHRDGSGRERLLLAETPQLPRESFCALDSYGLVVGLCAPVEDAAGSYEVAVDPVTGLSVSLDAPVLFTLQVLTAESFEGTFQDLAGRGHEAFKEQSWDVAIEHFEAALERVDFDLPSDGEIDSVESRLLESYLAEVERLKESGALSRAGRLAEAGLQRFDDSSRLWRCLGEWQLSQNRLADSISSLLQAQEFEQTKEASVLLEAAYLQLFEETSQRGDERAVEAVLLEAAERVPGSGAIRLELAELSYRLGAFDEAARLASEVPRLNATLRGAAEDLLQRIERELNSRDAVVIPIAPGSSSYRTEAVVDGGTGINFIIDTGATSTTLPRRVVEALGYDTRNARTVTVRTAGGNMLAPVVTLASLNVHGYVVRNLDVLVLPDNIPPLLGLNFLKYFRYTVDATRREFRLERP